MKGLYNGTLFMVEKMTSSVEIEARVKAETFNIIIHSEIL